MTLSESSQMSDAEGENSTTAEPESRGASATIIFDGQTIVGGVVSRTVTVKLHWLELPLGSVARQMTVFVPSEKNEPEGGLLVRVRLLSHESYAETLKKTCVPGGPAHSTTMLLGHR